MNQPLPTFSFRNSDVKGWEEFCKANNRKVVAREILDTVGEGNGRKFQVGRILERATSNPIYEGLRLMGHRSGTGEKFFRLYGWGASLEQAEKMAEENL